MKTIISIITAIILMWLVFFKLDPAIVNSIVHTLSPESANNGLIKLILWVFLVLVSGSITIIVSIFIGWVVYTFLEVFTKK